MIFADAGFLVAMLRARDGLHARAVKWSEAITQRLVLTDYVLLETVNLLSNTRDRRKAHAFLAQLPHDSSFEVIPASSELMEAGIDFHRRRSDKEWSLTDCISFLIMQERGIIQALAYDEHFVQAGFEALLRWEP